MEYKFDKSQIFSIALIVLSVMTIVGITEVKDLECSKAQNICKIYDSKGFNRKLEESFKLTDIKNHSIEHYNSRGKYTSTSKYKVVLELDNNIIFLPFGTRSEEAAESIYSNMMIQPEYKLKGSFFKSFLDLY